MFKVGFNSHTEHMDKFKRFTVIKREVIVKTIQVDAVSIKELQKAVALGHFEDRFDDYRGIATSQETYSVEES